MDNKSDSMKEPEFDFPQAEHFIPSGRKKIIDSVQTFLTNYRRYALLISGERGGGKTRLLHEVLGKAPIYRRLPRSHQSFRRILPVWIDLNSLGIPLRLIDNVDFPLPDNSSSNSGKIHSMKREMESDDVKNMKKDKKASQGAKRPLLSLKELDDVETGLLKSILKSVDEKLNPPSMRKLFPREKFAISDVDFLKSILQAISVQLSTHALFQFKGKGLRTKLGWLEYNFGFRLLYKQLHIPKGKHRLPQWIHKLKTGSKIGLIGFTSLFILKAIELFYNDEIHFAWKGSLRDFAIQFRDDAWTTLQALPENVLFNGSVLVGLTLFFYFLQRRARLLVIDRMCSKLSKLSYSENYSMSEESQGNMKFGAQVKNKMSGIFSLSSLKHEKAVFKPTVPYMLQETHRLLFFFHSLGIEPVIIIDELDKLGMHKNLHKLLRAGKRLCWPDDFEFAPSRDIFIVLDKIIRLKETLFKRLPTIVVTDRKIYDLLQRSTVFNGPFHTLFQEIIVFSTTKPQAIKELINEFVSNESSEAREQFENFENFLWIESKGLYSTALKLLRYYRMNGWKVFDYKKKHIDWATKARETVDKIMKSWNKNDNSHLDEKEQDNARDIRGEDPARGYKDPEPDMEKGLEDSRTPKAAITGETMNEKGAVVLPIYFSQVVSILYRLMIGEEVKIRSVARFSNDASYKRIEELFVGLSQSYDENSEKLIEGEIKWDQDGGPHYTIYRRI